MQHLKMAIAGKKVDADLLVATDPDADRLGVAVKNDKGEYVVLTGNQTGAINASLLLSQKKEKGTSRKRCRIKNDRNV